MAGSTHHEIIPMPDGARLAVTLYLPAGTSSGERVPVLLEALPYRKDDLTAGYRPEYVRFRDEFGYAVARLDLRGTGSSSGIMLDEYAAQEQEDLVHVIGWLAAQPWSTGSIGMFGTSWSGFNALQLAKIGPPALKAVVSSYASDDRWTDDVHYMGGALRLLDLVDYPLYMVAMNALPPVPELFGEGWREEWTRRAQQTPPWILTWLEEQRDAGYWRQGSIRESPLAPSRLGDRGVSKIACPTMLITGWADGYRNAAFRIATALHEAGTPVRVLAGPWSHGSPATSMPGPNVDQVPLMAQWWDTWLRDAKPPAGPDASADGLRPGVLAALAHRRRMDRALGGPRCGGSQSRSAAEASVRLGHRDGGGAGGFDGPLRAGSRRRADRVELVRGRPALGAAAGPDARRRPLGLSLLAGRRTGRRDGDRAPAAAVAGPARPPDRLRQRQALTRAPERPAQPARRPRLLNLAYRDGDAAEPRPCVPGEWIDVDIELEATAFQVSEGCELRLVLACADWPNTVAPPGTWSAIDLASSQLVLPISVGSGHPAPELPSPAVAFDPPEGSDDDDSWVTWRQGHDVLGGTTWAEVDHGSAYGGGTADSSDGSSDGSDRYGCGEHYTGRVEIDPADGVQKLHATTRYDLTRPGLEASSVARLDVTIDAGIIDVTLELDVRDGENLVAERFWHRRIPRRST